MINVKLTPEQESFVKIANDKGFTTKITRKEIEEFKLRTLDLYENPDGGKFM